ncbi:MAG TPA: type II secretion system F family protein [Verrucomicrobiae bacterium]|nr:type II secretion system F family protein [Verrucomicrobiae bacterium]
MKPLQPQRAEAAMSNYLYEAIDAGGLRSHGTLEVADQNEALRRIREMGLFPTKVWQSLSVRSRMQSPAGRKTFRLPRWMTERQIKPAALAVFTRQLATLVDVGMPLLRGLRLLQEQEENRTLRRVISETAREVEAGGTLSEALAAHPRVFSRLYVNMVKAGETGGIVELVLKRQADFLEKALRIKGKIKAAMFYPMAVLVVAAAIITLLLAFIIPRFQAVFDGLLNGRPMPAFTLAVLKISAVFKSHFLVVGMALLFLIVAFQFVIRTGAGRRWFDQVKLIVPVLGKVSRKVALSRFARTLGTLLGSGVPILQALVIVKETAGNVVVGDMISRIHENVKEGGTLAEPLKASRIFPAMIGGMVDVGEQTGALPDMLVKIADTSDEEVDNAVTAMTSLFEPVMIVFLAVVVGSIVVAMFLPLLYIMGEQGLGGGGAN